MPVTNYQDYLNQHPQDISALNCLRQMLLDAGLKEEIKWNSPTYTLSGKNLIGLGAFKSYVGLWFFQGALLTDSAKKLINAQKGKTQALRQWRFQDLAEIEKQQELIQSYIQQTIENFQQGRQVKFIQKPWSLPPLLSQALAENKELQRQFQNLTTGRQKEYAEFISSAKRESTQLTRLEKAKPLILQGVGLNDKYKKC